MKTYLHKNTHFLFDQTVDALIQGLNTVPEVSFAYLFGSFVSKESFRDIDIALHLQYPARLTYRQFQMAMKIGRLLEKSLPIRHEVDVRLLNEAPPQFQYEVIRTGVLIFSHHPQRQIEYEAKLMSQYLDYMPISDFFASQYLKGTSTMENRNRLMTYLGEMDEALADWERYRAEFSLDDLRTDRDKRNMTSHAMLVSIQSAIDLANQLIAQHRLRHPETYREAFELLAEASILTPELSDNLADLAGFRNVLVHIYWRLDLQRVL